MCRLILKCHKRVAPAVVSVAVDFLGEVLAVVVADDGNQSSVYPCARRLPAYRQAGVHTRAPVQVRYVLVFIYC